MPELAWILRAVPLAIAAHEVRSTPVITVAAKLCGARPQGRIGFQRALRVARRAVRLVAFAPGMTNTCLIRCLVAGALLADRDDVELVIGFHTEAEAAGPTLRSHAWLTVDGLVVGAGDLVPADHFSELLRITMQRPASHG